VYKTYSKKDFSMEQDKGGAKVRKLKVMAKDANTMTSPCQDANVWRDLLLMTTKGLRAEFPNDPDRVNEALQVFLRALMEGSTERSKRAIVLAVRLQASLNKIAEVNDVE